MSGPLDDAQKNEYLGQAKALLFPIEWNEPFGIVMIEAMACGTPVIAFGKGSVPEVIDEGVTGFVTHDTKEMIERIGRLSQISRERCRQQALSRFDVKKIARQYLGLFEEPKRVVIVTSGQPSANPRVVKEATGLDESGYKVTVIYVPLSPWAKQFDKTLFKKNRSIDWICVGYDLNKAPVKFVLIRIRRKIYELLFRYLDGVMTTYENAYIHYAPELKRRSRMIKGDLYIAHNLGALPAAVKAAGKWNAPVGFDAEDYHRGETSEGSLYKLAAKIEDKYIPQVEYLSAASPLIEQAYASLYPGIRTVVVNNTFSRKFIQPVNEDGSGTLRLFWFSQIVGIERGVETVIEAMNLLPDCDISLHILGNCTGEFRRHLLKLSKNPSAIHFLEPVAPDAIFAIASKFDIGLATEVPHSENRKLCLTNKLFTYVLAGNCIVASDTPAQKKFMVENPGMGILYKSNDARSLSEALQKLYDNRGALHAFRMKTHDSAERYLNWETEFEKLSEVTGSILVNTDKAIAPSPEAVFEIEPAKR